MAEASTSAARPSGASGDSQILLDVAGLTKRYGALVAVDNVTMQVADGEVRAVIGPYGAGKTTLFHLFTGVVKPTAGRVRFAGEEITGLPAHAVCQRGLSRTFQLTSLFPEMTARENVALAAQARHPRRWLPLGGGSVLREAREAGEAALDQLSLGPIADRPAGLLSHGDQRLLEVAMAMAQRPRVLLLDEPTQGLSVEETAEAVDTLARFLEATRVTVLLVEHDMEVVFRLAHRITVLHRGGVIADDVPEKVRADARVQEAYLGGMD
ncbi:MAG: ABC transporter ATP-binding protein [Hyphomicrobiaceae bacterium]